jgi:hypothetical protein
MDIRFQSSNATSLPFHTQKRLLQIAVAVLCLVPLTASLSGILSGPSAVGVYASDNPDLDSHFRYLSGIFLGLALGFLSCIPNIERKGERFKLLTACVVLGGLARLLSLVVIGQPSTLHLIGLALELGVVPALAFWQGRLSRAVG